MEPLMHTGDLAIVRRQPTYGVGDVVAYRVPQGSVGRGMVVIHRVTGGDGENGYVLHGDNRDHPDVWRPRTGDVAGRLQWHVPHAGTALFLARSPLVIAALAGFLVFWTTAVGGKRRGADADQPVVPVPLADVAAPAADVDVRPVAVRRRHVSRRGLRPLRPPAAAGAVLAVIAVTSVWRLGKHARSGGPGRSHCKR